MRRNVLGACWYEIIGVELAGFERGGDAAILLEHGNSGSPVFTKRLLGIKPGKLTWETPRLIGMIVGHMGDRKENILTQPDPEVMHFERSNVETNRGLALCVYTDSIMALVDRLGK